MSKTVFISSSFLKDIFSEYRIQTDRFSFSTLEMSFHCLLDCIVSDEKSATILILVFLAAFKIFLFIIGFQQFDYDVP